MNLETLREKLLASDIVVKEKITFKNGQTSEYYIDIKKSYGQPLLLRDIATLITQSLNPETTCLAASGYGGLPLGTMISQITGLPISFIRFEKKHHGDRGQVDGYIPNSKDKVSILDDTFATGNSIVDIQKGLASTNGEVLGCHVVIARTDPKDFQLKVDYLFKSDELAKSSKLVD